MKDHKVENSIKEWNQQHNGNHCLLTEANTENLSTTQKKKQDSSLADFVLSNTICTYHLEIKAGDIFPRILTVGPKKRADLIARNYLNDIKEIHSSREFHIYSGYFNSTGVSVISIGMGAPLMDFMVRETTCVNPGPMAIIRFGTCGLINATLNPGTVVTCGKGSVAVYCNYFREDNLDSTKTSSARTNDFQCEDTLSCEDISKDISSLSFPSPPYLISPKAYCDERLNRRLMTSLESKHLETFDGLNASGETFYSSQGRYDPNFDDGPNHSILNMLTCLGVDTMEMETHQLFYLAKKRKQPCYVAAAQIGILSRMSQNLQILNSTTLNEIELRGGHACLEALTGELF